MIIAVGLPRCGGHSLQQAISILTRSTCWHSVEPDKLHVVDGSAGFVECWLPITYLRRRFPDARFILNVRDEQDWSRSVRSVWDSRHGFNNPLWRQHEDSILDYARDYLDTRRHYLDGSDYLLIDITRNPVWEPLAMWLDLPIPDVPFPRADKLKPVPAGLAADYQDTGSHAIPHTTLSYF